MSSNATGKRWIKLIAGLSLFGGSVAMWHYWGFDPSAATLVGIVGLGCVVGAAN